MTDTSPKLKGEPTAESLASGLATLGRYGDSYMVHAAEGETVVPGEILDANPQLRNELFGQMRAMGIQDPNRYVVGNTLNSINPVTGQPEFFFKKLWKTIKKVFKKVAPTALGIVGNIIAPGFGGILGSALGTKLSGGSWKDALKTGAMAWGAQGLMGGIGALSKGQGIQGFLSGAGEGLMSPIKSAGNIFSSGAQNPFQQGIFGKLAAGAGSAAREGIGLNMETIFPQYDPNLGQGIATSSLPGGRNLVQQASGQQGQMVTLSNGQNVMVPRSWAHQQTFTDAPSVGRSMGHLSPEMSKEAMQQSARFMNPSASVPSATSQAAGAAAKKPDLSFWEKMQTPEVLGPTTAALVPAGLTYAFSEEQEEPTPEELAKLTDPQRSAYQQYTAMTAEQRQSDAGQSLRNQWYGPLQYTREQLAAITGVTTGQAGASQAQIGGTPPKGIAAVAGGLQLPNLMAPLSVKAAGGGEISGPGTGRSDSIPALLSDGEFVMTAAAVRNAGNGDRDRGAAKMYDIMHGFEGRA